MMTMKMLFRFVLVGAAAMFLLSSSAQAGTMVLSDSGSVGTFTLTNLGGGSFSLAIAGPSSLDVINGAPTGGIATSFDALLAFTASVSGTDVDVTGGPYTKTFGTAPSDAALSYDLEAGKIGTGFLKNGLILAGLISTVAPNALPDFDFSGMSGGTHTFVLTGAFYTGGANSMADVFATTGTSVIGNGSFAELSAPVPEPASVAMLGIGLSGLLTFRRFFKRAQRA
jgi:hypothetical protein